MAAPKASIRPRLTPFDVAYHAHFKAWGALLGESASRGDPESVRAAVIELVEFAVTRLRFDFDRRSVIALAKAAKKLDDEAWAPRRKSVKDRQRAVMGWAGALLELARHGQSTDEQLSFVRTMMGAQDDAFANPKKMTADVLAGVLQSFRSKSNRTSKNRLAAELSFAVGAFGFGRGEAEHQRAIRIFKSLQFRPLPK